MYLLCKIILFIHNALFNSATNEKHIFLRIARIKFCLHIYAVEKNTPLQLEQYLYKCVTFQKNTISGIIIVISGMFQKRPNGWLLYFTFRRSVIRKEFSVFLWLLANLMSGLYKFYTSASIFQYTFSKFATNSSVITPFL